jgi:hypothetical protein
LLFVIRQVLASRKVEDEQFMRHSEDATASRVQFVIDKLHIALPERAVRILETDKTGDGHENN